MNNEWSMVDCLKPSVSKTLENLELSPYSDLWSLQTTLAGRDSPS